MYIYFGVGERKIEKPGVQKVHIKRTKFSMLVKCQGTGGES